MSSLDENINAAIESRKEQALLAHGEANRRAMMRVGHPWQPIAEALAFAGAVIADGTGKRFRTWGNFGPEWTDDLFAATWYARRVDAEKVANLDEDAWLILDVVKVLDDIITQSMQQPE